MYKPIIFILISLILISCKSDEKLINEAQHPTLSKLMIITSELPRDVDYIVGTLQNRRYDLISEDFTITNDSAYCVFQDVPIGIWEVKVEAYHNNLLTYSGTSSVEVESGSISYISIFMEKINNTGVIHVGLIWDDGSEEVFIYDFEDNDLSSWGGPAEAEIINGELHLSSVQGFKYHHINPRIRTNYFEGDIEIDILPQGGRYSFETKGNAVVNNILDWGIFVQLKNDSVFVSQNWNGEGSQIFTNFLYEKNMWITLRFSFDNEEGEKGKFDFWIQPNYEGSTETYLGNYDYVGKNGKLKGVYEFVVSTGDPNLAEINEGRFDNIIFSVR